MTALLTAQAACQPLRRRFDGPSKQLAGCHNSRLQLAERRLDARARQRRPGSGAGALRQIEPGAKLARG